MHGNRLGGRAIPAPIVTAEVAACLTPDVPNTSHQLQFIHCTLADGTGGAWALGCLILPKLLPPTDCLRNGRRRAMIHCTLADGGWGLGIGVFDLAKAPTSDRLSEEWPQARKCESREKY